MKRHPSVDKVARGLNDLTIFAAVVRLMESGLLYDKPRSEMAARRIIRICEEQQLRLLRVHDQGVAELRGVLPEPRPKRRRA